MTYGSQAAAASQVFEQQRDLALREHTRTARRGDRRRPRAPGRRARTAVHVLRTRDRRRAPGGPARRRPVHRLPAHAGPPVSGPGVDADLPALVTIDEIRAAARILHGVAVRHAPRPVRAPGAPPVAQGGVPPADRRVQAAGRLRRGGHADAGRACARAHHLLVGQPRAGRRAGRPAVRRPGGDRHAVRCAGAQAGARRGRRRRGGHRRDGLGRAQRVAEEIAAARGLAIIPPYDDRADRGRAGHRGPGDRRGHARRGGGPGADRRRRAGGGRVRRRSRRWPRARG